MLKGTVMENTIHEECGVFGVYAPKADNVAATAYYGLFALQHRGQESCGIVVSNGGEVKSYRDTGIVNDVFTPAKLESLGRGRMAVGHVRYGTTGNSGRQNAQPIVVNHIKGSMTLAHNGNLVNSYELRHALEMNGSIFHTTSDTEVISYLITKERIKSPTIEHAVSLAMNKIKGAYSLVLMSRSKLLAVRDPHGFRPLCYGQKTDGTYIIASESCALDAVGAKFVRDVLPGEIVVFDHKGVTTVEDHVGEAQRKMCIFEYIYFARPDSVVDGCSVHDARVRAGEFLAKQHPVDADIVIGVPDSGLDAAIGYSRASGIPYALGLIKNKYIGRTFIAPTQKMREDTVRIKLNAIGSVIEGKRVVLIDDSIVRGVTSERLVSLIRGAGAKEIHMRISSPPFLHPCYYGTDIDSEENLIAHSHSVEETAKIIGVDSLGYLNFDSVTALPEGRVSDEYCTACFGGSYPTETPRGGKARLEKKGEMT